jgi:hypothetical protein
MGTTREEAVKELEQMNSIAMEYAKLHRLNFLSFHDAEPGFHQAYANCDDDMACEFAHALLSRLHPRNRANFFKIECKAMLNKTAREARNAALARHKEELRVRDAEIAALNVKLRQADEIGGIHYKNMVDAKKERNPYKGSVLFLRVCVIVLAVLCAGTLIWFSHAVPVASTDRPPALQKVKVVTYGYVDQGGTYRSYADGEPIEEVAGWMK